MSGHYGPMSSGWPSVIRSLTFESNLKKYGPYGVQQGTYFTFPVSGGMLVGFHGRSGWYLDCIGAYLSPIHSSNIQSPERSIVSASPTLSRSSTTRSQDGNPNKTYNILLALPESADNVKLHCAKLDSINEDAVENYSFRSRGIENSISSKMTPIYGSEKSIVSRAPVSLGPWGGNSGSVFDDGIYTGVRQIVLCRGAGISSIQIQYDRNGQSIWGNRHGGTTSSFKTHKIVFNYPFELLTAITGYFGTVLMMGPTAVKSLTFHTTSAKYGPYGEEQGTPFTSKAAEGMIVGFHGRKGWYLDAIGVHVLEGPVTDKLYPAGRPFVIDDLDNYSYGDSFKWSNKMIPVGGPKYEEVIHGVVKEPIPVGPGPWGGDGGKPWDDGVFSGVKQIVITRAEVIHSIQFEYDRNGQSVWSMRHGGTVTDATPNRIKFKYPDEILTCVSGYYCSCRNEKEPEVIKSLTFYSTRGRYGPFGEEFGKFFTSAKSGGKIVGFHGRSSICLHAIGVHMQHWLGNDQKPNNRLLSKFRSSTSK
eukprot:TRINITY_DN7643_c0_g1_i3.p1 TRINITY_DN7643_c0_g1~~TRINITY_DN7643_c0_g1_i3.p1  ORF type:complete len:531 (-),score=50.03 TRINITY_DN7643_c0_g1_i3:307-1899(-)